MKKRIKKIKKLLSNKHNVLVLGVLTVGTIGLITSLATRAAGSFFSVEPEAATVAGPATEESDASASGGQYVKFQPAGSSSSCAYPAFPTTSCTGWQHTGVTLTPYTGSSNISVAGTVIDSKDLGCLNVTASNVTIKRSRVRCAGGKENGTHFGVSVNDGVTGFVLEDTEVMSTVIPSNCTNGDPNLLTRPIRVAGSPNTRITRAYFHNVRTGMSLGDNLVVEDSLIISDCNPDPDSNDETDYQHASAIGTNGGVSNVIIRHNTFDISSENASGAIQLYPENWAGGANDNITVTQNFINARAGYCAYFGYTPYDNPNTPENESEDPNTRLTITNNVWGTKYSAKCGTQNAVAYKALDVAKFNQAYPGGWGNTWSGNTWRNGLTYNLTDTDD